MIDQIPDLNADAPFGTSNLGPGLGLPPAALEAASLWLLADSDEWLDLGTRSTERGPRSGALAKTVRQSVRIQWMAAP